MNIYEIDWRHSWLSQTLAALDRGLVASRTEIDDGIDVLEHADHLIGVAFVGIQVYITGSARDLSKVFRECPPAAVLRGAESSLVDSAEITQVEALWAAANCFKHRDEWIDWDRDIHKGTLCVLRALGISADTEFPCVRLLERLQGGDWALERLRNVPARWRESWFSRLRTAAAGGPA